MTCFLWFHKWSKWEPATITMHSLDLGGREVGTYEVSGQRRKCERCGFKRVVELK